MKFNVAISVILLFSMYTFVSFAEDNTSASSLGAMATTTSAEDVQRPGIVFLEWHADGLSDVFDVVMPWGQNGVSLELLANGQPVASTTLSAHTPFAQRFTFLLPVATDGTYAYTVSLCMLAVSQGICSMSAPVSLLVRGGQRMREDDLPSDEQTLERIDELKNIQTARNSAFYQAQNTRAQGLMPIATAGYVLRDGESNLDRIRRIVGSDVRSVLFSPTNNISRSDLYAAIAKFPAFCNESIAGESLDDACARELSALIAYITYYTSTGGVVSNSGMRNPPAAAFLVGNDVKRFERMFPSSDKRNFSTLAARFEAHPEDVYLAILWWYMTPQSPEPDPHSALLGIWVPNTMDRMRHLAPGFGATVNIATHGRSCKGGSAFDQGYTLRILYRTFLSAFRVVDTSSDLCITQDPFAFLGAAFVPQYWSKGTSSGSCSLDVFENDYYIQDPSSMLRCNADMHSATTTSVLSLTDYYFNAEQKIEDLIVRIGTSTGLSVATEEKSDPRTELGALIAGTYGNDRAAQYFAQPEFIPFAKLNALFYEGARPGADGSLEFLDPALLSGQYFAGDCFREDCTRGLYHQFVLAHKRYPALDIVLSIGGWDRSANFAMLVRDDNRKKFVADVRAFLVEHPEFGGIDISWMYPHGDARTNTDTETMRKLVTELRGVINTLYEQDGALRKFYLGVGASPEEVIAVGLPNISSMVDGVHLVTYDLHGPWEQVTGHDAQLFSTNIAGDTLSVASAVTAVHNAGVPAKKIIVGIPYYGRIWSGVPEGGNTLLPGFGVTVHSTSTATLIDYRTIAHALLGKGEFQYFEDILRGAAYLYDGSRFVSYDTPEMIEKKMQYVWQDGFGGVLLSDLMGDDGTLQDRVLSVIATQSEKKSCRLHRQPLRNLGTNSRGADVYALQTFLSCLGDIPAYVDINGNYGVATEDAVKRFQQAEGLEVTGVVGGETRARLTTY